MKEIKFRAWHRGQSKMYSIKRIELDDNKNDPILLKTNSDIGYIIANRRQCEIMQYTGLKDKNGVEIYEGDIVTAGDNYPSIIEWSHNGDKIEGTGWCLHEVYKDDYDRYHTTDAYTNGLGEVAGNIYENQELINE